MRGGGESGSDAECVFELCAEVRTELLEAVDERRRLVEFDGVDTLFLSRLIGVERADVRIGMGIKAKFRRKATWSVRDIYFVPAET